LRALNVDNSKAKVASLIAAFDTNKDNELDFEEFQRLIFVFFVTLFDVVGVADVEAYIDLAISGVAKDLGTEGIKYDYSFKHENLEQLRKIFNKIDADASGFIEAGEFEKVLGKLAIGETNVGQEAARHFAEYYGGVDKRVNFQEFIIFIEDVLEARKVTEESLGQGLNDLYNSL